MFYWSATEAHSSGWGIFPPKSPSRIIPVTRRLKRHLIYSYWWFIRIYCERERNQHCCKIFNANVQNSPLQTQIYKGRIQCTASCLDPIFILSMLLTQYALKPKDKETKNNFYCNCPLDWLQREYTLWCYHWWPYFRIEDTSRNNFSPSMDKLLHLTVNSWSLGMDK